MKSFTIRIIKYIQVFFQIIFIPIAFIHIYFLRIFILISRQLLIVPLYNSFLIIKLKKFGKNISFKYSDARIIGYKYIEFGENILIGKSIRLEAIKLSTINNNPRIIIGDNVQINDYCHFGACELIEIKKGCLIASRVFITDHFHGNNDIQSLEIEPRFREIYIKGPVVINENCWIGEGVSIMPNVVIGRNSIIGSNSVVTKSFPENVIIAGNPARIIKSVV